MADERAEQRTQLGIDAAIRERSIDAKIERLRTRLKQMPMDANVRAILLGILDLLGDEL